MDRSPPRFADWFDDLAWRGETLVYLHEVGGFLLRACAHHASSLHEVRSQGLDYRLANALGGELDVFWESFFAAHAVHIDDVRDLASTLDRICSTARELMPSDRHAFVATARLAAEALDRVRGHRFLRSFEERGRYRVEEGQAFPLAQPALPSIYPGLRLSPLPDNLNKQPVDHTTRLAIAPDLKGFELLVSTEHLELVKAPAQEDRVGAIDPITDENDLHVELVEGPHDKPEFAVTVRDPASNAEAVALPLRTLLDAGVRYIICPELVVSEQTVERIRAVLRESPRRFHIVVAGSVHTSRQNRSTVFLPHGGEVHHTKFNPFDLDGRFEAIHTAPKRITVYLGAAPDGRPSWSFTTLICKDALDPAVISILMSVRPSLVLIPAMSPDPSVFRGFAEGLGIAAQAHVIVANHADAPSAGFLEVYRPLREDHHSMQPSRLKPVAEVPLFPGKHS